MRTRLKITAILALLLSIVAAPYAQYPKVDAIFIGSFLTLDESHPQAEAIAISGGRIIAVGSQSSVEALATNSTRKIKFDGFALPGFADAHIHVEGVGEQLEQLNLRRLSKRGILDKVAEVAHRSPRARGLLVAAGIRASGSRPFFPLQRISIASAVITPSH